MRNLINVVEEEQLDELFGFNKPKPKTAAQIKQRLAAIQQQKDAIIRDPAKREEVQRLTDEQKDLTRLLSVVVENVNALLLDLIEHIRPTRISN